MESIETNLLLIPFTLENDGTFGKIAPHASFGKTTCVNVRHAKVGAIKLIL